MGSSPLSHLCLHLLSLSRVISLIHYAGSHDYATVHISGELRIARPSR